MFICLSYFPWVILGQASTNPPSRRKGSGGGRGNLPAEVSLTWRPTWPGCWTSPLRYNTGFILLDSSFWNLRFDLSLAVTWMFADGPSSRDVMLITSECSVFVTGPRELTRSKAPSCLFNFGWFIRSWLVNELICQDVAPGHFNRFASTLF